MVNSNTLDSLLDENWETVLSSKDVNNAYKYFLVKFTEIYNRCCPVKMVRNSTSNRDKPWITNGLKNACRKKNTLYIKIMRSRTVISETKYKLYKNKLTAILRFSEKSYYSKHLLENKGNAKGIWKILNTVINKKTRPNELPRQFINNGETISSNKAIASEFNVFFSTIGPPLADSIPILDNGVTLYDYLGQPNRNYMFITPVSEKEIITTVKSCKQNLGQPNRNSMFITRVGENEIITTVKSCKQNMGQPNRNSMFITPVSEDEIITTVKSCKPKHSMDCDDMSMYVVSTVIWPIVKPLAHIFNLSFTSGIFPEDMKIGKVIPLFKNDSKTDLTNYRPISIISQFSKIIEKIFCKRRRFFDSK